MKNPDYDWVVVGGGIAGISLSEMLCRNGKKVLLIEKNPKLASETTKEFHEWWHTGVLFSLVSDQLATARYLLGALDDLLEYYSGFKGMNISKQETGIKVIGEKWFNDDHIVYQYRNRPTNPIWMYSLAKSILLSEKITRHDWLRRHGGGAEITGQISGRAIFNQMLNLYREREPFISKESSDFTMNSRSLLSDLLKAATKNGLEISCNDEFKEISEHKNYVKVVTKNSIFCAKNIVFCSPDLVSKLFGARIKYGYAPMGVFEGVRDEQESFVRLDFNVKNCINLLKKRDGYGLAGGITVSNFDAVSSYFDYVHKEHLKINPELRLVHQYVGVKKELVESSNNRNYQYHIQQNSYRQWSVVLGKFSLFASLCAEFYRRTYGENPCNFIDYNNTSNNHGLISPTYWEEIERS